MGDIPKFKQNTTLAFAMVNKSNDQSNFGDSTYATGEKPPNSERNIDAITADNDTRWFWDQYEENIGTAEGKKSKVRDVVKWLFSKSKRVKESDTYTGPVNPKTDAYLFTWPHPTLTKKCLCGEFECVCKGCTLFPPKEIPTGPNDWFDWNNLPFYQKSITNLSITPANTLILNLKAKLSEEAKLPLHLISEGPVDRNQNCPEFCGSRCDTFKIPDAEKDSEYWYTPEQLETIRKIKITLKQQNKSSDNKQKESGNAEIEKNMGDVERK